MKKQIEVKLHGLNEFGVSEINEHYKHNIIVYSDQGWSPFVLGDKLGFTKKRFKNIKSFYEIGLDNYIGTFDCTQLLLDENGEKSEYDGSRFSLQIKHFVHEIFEVEVVETMKKITL